jgi:hypothetical protein
VPAAAAQAPKSYCTLQTQRLQLTDAQQAQLAAAEGDPSLAAQLLPQLMRLLPQLSPAWRAARATLPVTASSLSAALGFHEPSGVKALGLSPCMTDHSKAVRVYGGSSGAAAEDTPAVQWGRAHESNSRLLLQQNLSKLPGFERCHSFTLKEAGLWVQRRAPGVSVGASPDDLLEVRTRGACSTYLVEYKSKFPFVPNRRKENSGGYRHLERPLPSTLCPTYFAQVQLAMSITDTQVTLLLHYSVDTTHVWQVQRSDQWCQEALAVLDALWAAYQGQGEALPPDFVAKSEVAAQHKRLLRLTKELAASKDVVALLPALQSLPAA